MSVQLNPPRYSIESMCPIVLNQIEAVLTFKTATGIAVNHDVNSSFSSCQPNDYDLRQVYTADQLNKCCGVDLLAKKPVSGMYVR